MPPPVAGLVEVGGLLVLVLVFAGGAVDVAGGADVGDVAGGFGALLVWRH